VPLSTLSTLTVPRVGLLVLGAPGRVSEPPPPPSRLMIPKSTGVFAPFPRGLFNDQYKLYVTLPCFNAPFDFRVCGNLTWRILCVLRCGMFFDSACSAFAPPIGAFAPLFPATTKQGPVVIFLFLMPGCNQITLLDLLGG